MSLSIESAFRVEMQMQKLVISIFLEVQKLHFHGYLKRINPSLTFLSSILETYSKGFYLVF